MANYTTNDRGETVLAVGAPASIVRAEIEHPNKIAAINEMYCQGADLSEVIAFLKENDINSELERESIIHHTWFNGWGV